LFLILVGCWKLRLTLAVIAYQLLTGQVPFRAETPYATTVQHIISPPPPPRQINPNLSLAVEQVLLHGLAKEPAQRPASAHTFVAELQNALKNVAPETTVIPQTLPSAGESDAATVLQGKSSPLNTPPLTPHGPADEQSVEQSREAPAPSGISRRQLLIGGSAALLIGGGLGAWAITSRLHSSPLTTIPTPKPTPNPNVPTMTLVAHTQPISSLAWSPTAPNILASAGKDSQVMLWDISAIQQRQASQTSPRAKQQFGSSPTSSVLLAWSVDGRKYGYRKRRVCA
jgi:eukaryotic-like serine/threonine-protein kinase